MILKYIQMQNCYLCSDKQAMIFLSVLVTYLCQEGRLLSEKDQGRAQIMYLNNLLS